MKEVAPTYEEFYKEVKEGFRFWWKSLSEKEVDDYLHSEEAQEEIKYRYNENLNEFNKGEIDRKTFMIGGASSVAYCLQMMY
jgi:hypothetical protein